jgi:hypothetical protein
MHNLGPAHSDLEWKYVDQGEKKYLGDAVADFQIHCRNEVRKVKGQNVSRCLLQSVNN